MSDNANASGKGSFWAFAYGYDGAEATMRAASDRFDEINAACRAARTRAEALDAVSEQARSAATVVLNLPDEEETAQTVKRVRVAILEGIWIKGWKAGFAVYQCSDRTPEQIAALAKQAVEHSAIVNGADFCIALLNATGGLSQEIAECLCAAISDDGIDAGSLAAEAEGRDGE